MGVVFRPPNALACDAEPWAVRPVQASVFFFGAGHTITAFATSVPLWSFYPALTEGLLFCAISVAISRILLSMHFVSDVIADALIGSTIGWAAFLLWR